MPIPYEQAATAQISRLDKALAQQSERQQWAAAGIAWPPLPYQRVEVTGNSHRADPPGRLLGTVLTRDGSYTGVLLDHNSQVRECYCDNELRPMLDECHPGWVPYALWLQHIAPTADRTLTYDLKLTDGTWRFGCFAKPLVTGDYQFQEAAKPYGRYNHHSIAGIRPSEH